MNENTLRNHRVAQLKAIYAFACASNDEDFLTQILHIIPDEPLEEDYIYIAESEDLYETVCSIFADLVAAYEWLHEG